MQIEEKVLLLGMLKKQDDESFLDVLMQLENSGVFLLKEGKRLFKKLKNEGFIQENNEFTIQGVLKAEEVEKEFKL